MKFLVLYILLTINAVNPHIVFPDKVYYMTNTVGELHCKNLSFHTERSNGCFQEIMCAWIGTNYKKINRNLNVYVIFINHCEGFFRKWGEFITEYSK